MSEKRSDGLRFMSSRERISLAICEAAAFHKLDLSDLVVLTEGAPNYYGTTPVIAALARAKKVYALVKDPTHRLVAQRYVERLCQVAETHCNIEVVAAKRAEIVSEADIVTNTGPVRPIDARMVSLMKNTAVVPLMYETWERRSEDVDIDACKRRGVVVIGTDEEKAGVFRYIGVMAIRQLLDAGIEIVGCRIVVRASNRFGSYVMRALSRLGARVFAVCSLSCSDLSETMARKAGTSLRDSIARRFLAGADALVVVTNPQDGVIVGRRGEVTGAMLHRLSPGITVAQFTGLVDRFDLRRTGVAYVPPSDPGRGHMGITAGSLGPIPRIALHTASLRVAEVAVRARLSGVGPASAAELACRKSLGQLI
jgi:hypothetical protein